MAEVVGRASEAAIDPDRVIVDAHHHLYDRFGTRYLFHEYHADLSRGHNVRATVYVESRSMVRADEADPLRLAGETEFANGMAAMAASGTYGPARMCAAIVSYADLRPTETLDTILDAHIRAGGSRFRGIRQHGLWDEEEAVNKFMGPNPRPPRGMLLDPKLQQGLKRLAARGLTYDTITYHHQLPELIELTRAVPEATTVLNHMGFALGVGRFAGRRHEVFAEWRGHLRELAKSPNVYLKVGGLGLPFWGFGFETWDRRPGSDELAEVWKPYVEAAVEAFGADRCMLESNFPPDAQSCDYAELWNALKKIVRDYSEVEQTALFSGTAAKVYRIDL